MQKQANQRVKKQTENKRNRGGLLHQNYQDALSRSRRRSGSRSIVLTTNRTAAYDPSVSLGGIAASYNKALPTNAFSLGQAPLHPIFGPGIRVAGCQYLSNITTAADNATIFGTLGNTIALSPAQLGGRAELESRSYSRYCFRKAILEYTSLVPSTTAGAFILAYVPDGDVSTAAVGNSFTGLMSVVPGKVIPFFCREEHCYLPIVDYRSDNLYYCNRVTATGADQRLSIQGQILGAPSGTMTVATEGILRVHFIIDLYSPCTDAGDTLSLRVDTDEELKALQAKLAELRMAPCPTPLSTHEANIVTLNNRLLELREKLQQSKSGREIA